MSTRANIRIISKGLEWNEEAQLYRGHDGYPTSVLPSLVKAYGISGGGWEAGRARKVAAYICASNYEPAHDEGGIHVPPYVAYEPDAKLQLRSYIEWAYKLVLVNHEKGDMSERPTWEVEVYALDAGHVQEFIDNPCFENLTLIARGEVTLLSMHAQEIEISGEYGQPYLPTTPKKGA